MMGIVVEIIREYVFKDIPGDFGTVHMFMKVTLYKIYRSQLEPVRTPCLAMSASRLDANNDG